MQSLDQIIMAICLILNLYILVTTSYPINNLNHFIFLFLYLSLCLNLWSQAPFLFLVAFPLCLPLPFSFRNNYTFLIFRSTVLLPSVSLLYFVTLMSLSLLRFLICFGMLSLLVLPGLTGKMKTICA